MDRREVLDGLIQCSFTLLVLPSQECLDATMPAGALLRIENVAPGYDIDSLGNEYLRIFPKYRNKAILMDEIYSPGGVRTDRKESSANPRILTEFLSDQIARDFDRDATLRIGGWIYAETELKLCALQYISRFE